jgi:dTDP-4-dehydrorhamnose reductase
VRIMLTGAQGQVGWELARSLQPLGEVHALDRRGCDLSQPETLPAIVQRIEPDVIVNAAAYTAVDDAEDEEALANTINGRSAGILAEEARKRDALLVHYSTDYVFNGTRAGLYTEDDETDPVNAYGRSKLMGEQLIRESGARHLIFRTSWVYARRRKNFIGTIQRLARERSSINVVMDQVGAPTSAELIADVTLLSLYRSTQQGGEIQPESGIYNLTAGSHASWHEVAVYVVEEMLRHGCELSLSPDSIHPIPSAAYPTKASRPANSKLSVAKIERALGVTMPPWQSGVAHVVGETLG